jgi:hypothetical protein
VTKDHAAINARSLDSDITVSDTELEFLEFHVQYMKRSFGLSLNIPVKIVLGLLW